MDKRLPWMKWYPADWRADPRLRMCSLAARGLWIELLGYMHQSPRYGYLLIADAVPTMKQIAMLVGDTQIEVQRAFNELKDAGVFSTEDGVVFSRRMVRDNAKATEDRINGKGGGNPRLRDGVNLSVNGGVNPPGNQEDKAPDKAQMLEARVEGSVSSLRSDTAASQLDVKRSLWASGKRLLIGYGKSEKDAGELIGKWRKQAGSDGALIDILSKAEAGSPAGDVVAYIEAMIGRPARNNGQGAPCDRAPSTEDGALIWRSILTAWKRAGCKPGDWPEGKGVPPGRPGCQVPKHLLREFDIPALSLA